MRASRFRIKTPRPVPGYGTRSQARPGRGEAFFDHRPYLPGDDPRLLDWKASARLGEPIVRQKAEERPGKFWLWIDGSPSMALFGKSTYAERVARVLVEAARGERLRLLTPGGPRRPGKRLEADPRGLLAARPRARGTPLLITDGLEEGEFAAYLKRLPPFHLILVLAPEEIAPPPLEGVLEDVESGERVTVNPDRVPAYRAALEVHLATLERIARRRGNFALLKVGEPILPALYRAGVLELR